VNPPTLSLNSLLVSMLMLPTHSAAQHDPWRIYCTVRGWCGGGVSRQRSARIASPLCLHPLGAANVPQACAHADALCQRALHTLRTLHATLKVMCMHKRARAHRQRAVPPLLLYSFPASQLKAAMLESWVSP